jgi:triosephosphate isomerase
MIHHRGAVACHAIPSSCAQPDGVQGLFGRGAIFRKRVVFVEGDVAIGDRLTERDQIGGSLIAYEPVWAIGTGKVATPAEADEAHRHIRSRLRQWFGGTAAEACRLLYGGSVKPDNIRELIGLQDVDGALVGGASLEVRSFFDIADRSRQA